MKKPGRFGTETELCAAFAAWAREQGWVPYAETAGWDLILVRGDGTQIGVQAKLRLNLKVLEQAVPDRWDADRVEGPDYRALLVPEAGYVGLVSAFGLIQFRPDSRDGFTPGLGTSSAWYLAHYWNPERRVRLPEFVPDVAAGASAPLQLTDWKIRALRVCAVLELRGQVTRADFKRYGVDHRRWTAPGSWLQAVPGTPGAWSWRPGADSLTAGHPEVYPRVREIVRAELAGTRLTAK